MPQMAPLNWLFLFLFMTMIFLVFNSMNYFSFLYSSSYTPSNQKKNINNWKW
uniref:ATP synthase complex subunit 8 n=1 Tax=Staphylinidae sp. BMNH 1274173 TaxID=1796553 RepID=A0A140EGP0_9COLE|nr:ATP synthase F0 subunit 8 [Staphylinidae sp. BMNH 1274173]